jgi:hypothetical protein
MTRQGVAAIRRAAPPAPGSPRLPLVTAGSGAPADRAAFQGDAPSLEAGSISVDPDGVAGRPEPAPPTSLLSTAPLPGEIVASSPHPLDSRGQKPRRMATGAVVGPRDSGQQRSITVPHGQSNPQFVSHNRPSWSRRSVYGMQGVRGSNPLSSTRHNASAGLPLRAVCQQIVSRSLDVTVLAL